MVFQLLCIISDLGFHSIALGKYTASSMHIAFNMVFWCSDVLCKGGRNQTEQRSSVDEWLWA